MPNLIQVKRSAVSAKVPTTTDLALGEIAVNTFDGKMYIKKDNGTASIVEIGAGGSGTVTSVSGTGTVAGLTLTGTVTTSGSLTLGGNLSITADMIYDNFTATASQTTFTPSQTYTSGKIQVLVNGVMMINGVDVTVTSGTSVVMTTGLTVNDRVTLIYPI